jgi:choline kinase
MLIDNKRKGIILAAGLGSRLCTEKTDNSCKPLMIVDDLSLLVRTICSLGIAGCDQAIIVLGHQAETIENFIRSKYCGPVKLTFVVNHKYSLQNGISVLTAKPFIEDEFVLTMADHVLDDEIMYRIRDCHPPEGGAVLCVDYKLETIFDIDDATKVLVEDTLIKKIGKDLSKYNCIDTGVFVGSGGLMDAIDQVYQQKGDASLSEGVQFLANQGLMEILDIKDAFWQDVDNKEMLLHAEKLLRLQTNGIKKSAQL